MDERSILSALASRQTVKARTLVIVAHPDDEVLGLSIALRLMRPLCLLHATDAAAAGAGAEARAKAADRFSELTLALAELGVEPGERSVCPFHDGSLIERATELSTLIEARLDTVDVIVTHAFEGGHPDHDACALAAQTACARMFERTGRMPARIEFAVYARQNGRLVSNCFPVASAATVLTLTTAEADAKRRALNAFVSQRHVVDRFPLTYEQVRAAPFYQFEQPRAAEDVLFAAAEPERERRWRDAAARVVEPKRAGEART